MAPQVWMVQQCLPSPGAVSWGLCSQAGPVHAQRAWHAVCLALCLVMASLLGLALLGGCFILSSASWQVE